MKNVNLLAMAAFIALATTSVVAQETPAEEPAPVQVESVQEKPYMKAGLWRVSLGWDIGVGGKFYDDLADESGLKGALSFRGGIDYAIKKEVIGLELGYDWIYLDPGTNRTTVYNISLAGRHHFTRGFYLGGAVGYPITIVDTADYTAFADSKIMYSAELGYLFVFTDKTGKTGGIGPFIRYTGMDLGTYEYDYYSSYAGNISGEGDLGKAHLITIGVNIPIEMN